MSRKVLFLDSVHPVLEEKLNADGLECIHDYSCTSEELKERIADCFGLVIRSRLVLDRNILEAAGELKFIARSGSGMENIDTDYAESKGILCVNSPEGNRDAVGEHVIGMILALLNKLKQGDEQVRELQWKREENRGRELSSQVVGIIGFGNTGSALAKKLSSFGCEIIAQDKFKSDFSNEDVKEVSLEEILERSTIVSVHIPYNEENHYFINEDLLSRCSRSIMLVNTSRGKVLDTQGLVSAMRSGKVETACIDVLEYETSSFELEGGDIPEAMQYLINSEKVLLSPHVAGWTEESYFKLSEVLYDKIRKAGLY